MKKAFTLVELIVVITILAILGAISFVSLNNFSASARDAKRLSDVRSLYTKFTLENIKGTRYSELVKDITTSEMQIDGNIVVVGQGVPNFEALKENRNNFLDPSTNADYPVAFHEAGLVASIINPPSDPSILEIATINEEKNLAVVVGNYSPQAEGDTLGLIINPTTDKIITNGSGNLPYDIGNGNGENTEESAIEIYGDEGETEIRACNKWITDNIPAEKGEWIWVPARPEYFINDLGGRELTEEEGGYKGMDDEYYRRLVKDYEGKDYICKGFAVARYEMSYSEAMEPNSVGNGVNFNTIAFTGSTVNGGIVSIADRYPIADIKQIDAINACKSIGTNFHLITNNEWMSIARNIEQQAENWSSGVVGNGYISTGLSGIAFTGCGDPTNLIATLSTDMLYTGLIRGWSTKTGIASNLIDINNCNDKRQLALSNGQVIWDLSGNVWENVNKANTIDGTNYDLGQTSVTGCTSISGWDTSSNGCWGVTEDKGSYGPSIIGGIDKGFGNITSPAGLSNNVLLRGSTSADGGHTGIFSLGLHYQANFINRTASFRCSL